MNALKAISIRLHVIEEINHTLISILVTAGDLIKDELFSSLNQRNLAKADLRLADELLNREIAVRS